MSTVVAPASQNTTAWPFVPLAKVCLFKPPKSIPRKQLDDDSMVSFVPMKALGELAKYFEPKDVQRFGDVVKGYTYFADGDVLCAKITPCFENGKLGVARGLENGVGFGSSEFVVMRASDKLLPEFLYHFLSRDAFRETGAKAMSGAVGHKRVPKEYFENLSIPLPPLDEQKRIVAMLDQAFAALDRARAHAEANLADAAELFEENLRTLLDTVVHANPIQTLEVATNAIVDCEHKTAPVADVGYPSIRTPNVGKGVLHLDGVNRVSAATYQAWTRRAVPEPGDLIMAREAPAGNVGVIPCGEMVCLGQRTLLIKPNPKNTNSEFLASLLLHPTMQRRLLEKSSGATVMHVNMRDIRALPIPELPALSEQNVYARRISEVGKTTKQIRRMAQTKLSELDLLRQSILQKAFTGQLT